MPRARDAQERPVQDARMPRAQEERELCIKAQMVSKAHVQERSQHCAHHNASAKTRRAPKAAKLPHVLDIHK